jgi:glycosyltransferase involved in cell wall biosynthesis
MDARALQIHIDGIGRYCLGVMESLSSLKPDWKLSVIVNPEVKKHVEGLSVNPVESSVARFHMGENRRLVPLIESSGANCYLNFSMAGPVPSVPTLLSVHDLMVLNVPGYFGSSLFRNFLARLLFRRKLKKSIAHANAISVLSGSSLNDLQNSFPGAEKKAFVAGAGQDLFLDDEILSPKRKDYLLYVGNARAYKNVTRLIVAYSRLKAINPNFPEMKMVVRRDRAFKDFMRDVEDCSARDSITILSRVCDDELRLLYRQCAGLVMPSLKEGFGLPALEAMAAGCPVVASAGTALEELVGDAGILVNPESVEDIMHGMALLTSQPELRNRLSSRAFERAQHYSWKKTAGIIAERIEVITS